MKDYALIASWLLVAALVWDLVLMHRLNKYSRAKIRAMQDLYSIDSSKAVLCPLCEELLDMENDTGYYVWLRDKRKFAHSACVARRDRPA